MIFVVEFKHQYRCIIEDDWDRSDFIENQSGSEFSTKFTLPDGRSLMAYTRIYRDSLLGQATIRIPIESKFDKYESIARRNMSKVTELGSIHRFMTKTLKLGWNDFDCDIFTSSIGVKYGPTMSHFGIITANLFVLPDIYQEADPLRRGIIGNPKKVRIFSELFLKRTGISLEPVPIDSPSL